MSEVLCKGGRADASQDATEGRSTWNAVAGGVKGAEQGGVIGEDRLDNGSDTPLLTQDGVGDDLQDHVPFQLTAAGIAWVRDSG